VLEQPRRHVVERRGAPCVREYRPARGVSTPEEHTVSPAATTGYHQSASYAQRPWRPLTPGPLRPGRTVIRAFAAPVVQEIIPRRDAAGAADATW